MTSTIRHKLAQQYNIRDIPAELLDYFIFKYRQRFSPTTLALSSTIAFCIATEWQKGLTAPTA